MFMQDTIEEILSQTGIQRARPASGRRREHIYDEDTLTPARSGHTIELSQPDIIANANTLSITSTAVLSLSKKYYGDAIYRTRIKRSKFKTAIPYFTRQSVSFLQRKALGEQCNYSTRSIDVQSLIYGDTKSPVIILPVVVIIYRAVNSVVSCKEIFGHCGKDDRFSLKRLEFRTFIQLDLIDFFAIVSTLSGSKRDICLVVVFLAVFTVRTLYAGTLVTCWTTAPSHQTRWSSSALLAAFCFFLATLTIAARCYASSNATHPLVQLSQNPQSFSSIDTKNSNSHRQFSKLVLSKLFKNSHRVVQSDTRIILTNSKKLLYDQNFNNSNRTGVNVLYRTKRDFETNRRNTLGDDKYYLKKRFDADDSTAAYKSKDESDVSKTQSNEIPKYLPNTSSDSPEVVNSGTTFTLRTNKNVFKKSAIDSAVLNLEKRSDVTVFSANNSEGAWNASANLNISRVSSTLQVVDHQNDFVADQRPIPESGTERPMPPVHGHTSNSSVSEWGVLVLVLSAIVLTVALGLVTCVLSHYRSSAEAGGTAADPHDAAQTPTTAPMLSVVSAGAAAGVGGMDRLRGRGAARDLAAARDRQVRLHTVHTDIAINLPPSINMPDGEEHPFNSRLHIRDAEQESEIYQKCIRPPPNRTVLESESPPPYRSSSAGLLGSISGSSSGSSDWSGGSAPLVVRCHSMSSTSKRPEAGPSGQKTDFLQRTVKIFTGKKSQPPNAPTLPVVIVPSRPRRTSEQQQNSTSRPKPSV